MNSPISFTTIESTIITSRILIIVKTNDMIMANFLPKYSMKNRIKTRPIVVPIKKAYCILVISPIF